MKIQKKLLLSAYLSLCITALFAENDLKFRCIKAENGLASNTVACVFQDSKGYMWFGTNDGLTRFNSSKYKTYRNDTFDPNSIINNCVYIIYEDRDGVLWIGTDVGICSYDYTTDRFSSLYIEHNGSNLLVNDITEDGNGELWIATLGNGIYRYDKYSGRIINYRHRSDAHPNDDIESDYVPKILVDELADIWCITSGSNLYRFDRDNQKFTRTLIRDNHKRITEANAFSLCNDFSGNLWIAGWNSGIFKYDKQKRVFYNYMVDNGKPVLSGRIHTIQEVEPGVLMLGSDAGLTRFDTSTGEHNTISYYQNIDRSLSDNFVYNICRDREGGLWVATYFGGVNYATPNSFHFMFRTCNSATDRGRVVSKFCEAPDGRIFIGSDDGGLFCYNPHTDQTQPVIVDRQNPNLNIHALFMDWPLLWVGTYSNGLYRKNLLTGRIEHWARFSDRFSDWNDSVYSLYKDKAGRLWVGAKTGIYTYQNDCFDEVSYLSYNSDVVEICGGNNGELWFASINQGLLHYNPKTKLISNMNNKEGNSTPTHIPPQIRALSFHNGLLWIGTAGRGLYAYNPQTKECDVVSLGNNMTDITICQIIPDNDNLWVTTNFGLVRHVISSVKNDHYDHEDGLLTNIFNFNSGIKASDGRIYLGANGGFNIFNPETLKLNQTVPQVVFTEFKIKGHDVAIGTGTIDKDINELSEIRLKRGQSTFSLGFSVLSYCSPQKNRYRYKLENIDKDWVEGDYKCNSVMYTDIARGSYVFSVAACNNDGVWSDVRRLSITVVPYWWASNLAIAFYIIAAAALILLLWRTYRNHQRQKREVRAAKASIEKERARSDAEIEFFTNIAHEIRTPVTLIMAPTNEILSSEGLSNEVKSNLLLIKKSSDRLYNLANEILGFRKHSSAYIVTPTDIESYTRQLVEGFLPVAKPHGIELTFSNLSQQKITADINQEMYSKVVSNLMTNALKFTKNKVDVTTELFGNDYFRVVVADNGVGIAKSELDNIFYAFRHYDKPTNMDIPGFGLGLSIANMLVRKMDAKIQVESVDGQSTIFTVTIPLVASSAEIVVQEDTSTATTVNIDKNRAIDDAATITEHKKASEKKHSSERESEVTILVVDDDNDMRNYMEHALCKSYSILTAKDGQEAYELLGRHSVDIIVSDVVMPRMNGIELCRRLKSEINFCHIPFILLSVNTDKSTKASGIEGGADVYLDKPVDMEYLIVQINSLLEKRQMLWNVFSKRPFMSLSAISQTHTDEVFLNQLNEIIENNFANPSFAVGNLASMTCMSRSVLFAKVKTLTGDTPNNFIKLVRLRKAAEYLMSGTYKVNEICFLVGFNTPSYFAKCFQEQFGVMPKDFVAQQMPANFADSDKPKE